MGEIADKQLKTLKKLIETAETNLAGAKELLASLVGGDDENTRLFAVRPIGDTAAGIASRRLAVTSAFVNAVPSPQLFAGCGIQRPNDALTARGFVQYAAGHNGSGFATIHRKHRVAIALRGPAE